MTAMKIRVECYAGYRADEEPRALDLGERRIRVDRILERWIDPDYRYFKVQAEGRTLILRRQDASGEWELS